MTSWIRLQQQLLEEQQGTITEEGGWVSITCNPTKRSSSPRPSDVLQSRNENVPDDEKSAHPGTKPSGAETTADDGELLQLVLNFAGEVPPNYDDEDHQVTSASEKSDVPDTPTPTSANFHLFIEDEKVTRNPIEDYKHSDVPKRRASNETRKTTGTLKQSSKGNRRKRGSSKPGVCLRRNSPLNKKYQSKKSSSKKNSSKKKLRDMWNHKKKSRTRFSARDASNLPPRPGSHGRKWIASLRGDDTRKRPNTKTRTTRRKKSEKNIGALLPKHDDVPTQSRRRAIGKAERLLMSAVEAQMEIWDAKMKSRVDEIVEQTLSKLQIPDSLLQASVARLTQ